jgi:WD40 repeat protein
MPPQISLVHQFEQQKRETLGLRFSLDGKRLGSTDGTDISLWQLDERGCWNYERSLPVQADFDFALDNRLYILSRQSLQVISLDDGKDSVTVPWVAMTESAFSPDRRWLITGDARRNILLWDLLTYQCSPIPIPFPNDYNETGESNETARNFRFTPDGQRIVFVVSSPDGYVHICSIDPIEKRIMRQKTFRHAGGLDLAISPNGKLLAAITSNHQIYNFKEEVYVYDLESLQLLHVFPQTTDKRYFLLAFSPDSRYLASCKRDGLVDIFSLTTFDRVVSFAAHPGLATYATEPIGGLDWSKTGYIATGGASVFEHDMDKTDYSIKIWKVDSDKE